MGLNYSFELFFPRERRWDALQAIARRVPPDGKHSTLVIEDGEQRTLPFENTTYRPDGFMEPGYLSPVPLDMVGRRDGEIPDFRISMLFGSDKPIADFAHDDHQAEPGSPAPIGEISFSIVNDLVAFYARSKEGSGLIIIDCRLFAEDVSPMFDTLPLIKRTFVDIAREAGGLCVTCSTFSGGVWPDRADVLWLDGRECHVRIPDDWLPLAEVRRLVAQAEGAAST